MLNYNIYFKFTKDLFCKHRLCILIFFIYYKLNIFVFYAFDFINEDSMRFIIFRYLPFLNIFLRKFCLFQISLIYNRVLSFLNMEQGSKATSTTTVTSRTPLNRASAPPARWICFNDYEELDTPNQTRTDFSTCCKKIMFAFPVFMVLSLTAFCYYAYVVELCICMFLYLNYSFTNFRIHKVFSFYFYCNIRLPSDSKFTY